MPIGWQRPFLLRYSDGGAWAERTLQRSVAALADIRLQKRVPRSLCGRRMDTQKRWPYRWALAPACLAGMDTHRGKMQAARVAAAIRRMQKGTSGRSQR